MQHIYGVVDKDQTHIDISTSEKGAKQYATRNGYKEISIRYNCGYVTEIIAIKKGRKWVTIKN